MELSLGVGVVVNDSVSITIKRATTLTRVNLSSLKDRRHIQDVLLVLNKRKDSVLICTEMHIYFHDSYQAVCMYNNLVSWDAVPNKFTFF